MYIKWSAVFLFVLTCCAAPWFFGGNHTGTRTVLLVAGLVLLLLGIANCVRSKQLFSSIRFSWLLATAAVVLVGLQVINSTAVALPDSAETSLGQQNIAQADQGTGSWLPKTAYAAATRERFVELILPLGFFFAASCLIVERKSIAIFFSAVAVLGVAISLFGIAQKLSWNGHLYWIFPNKDRGVPFGPFINKNNCGEFLLICASATTFLFVWRVVQTLFGHDDRPLFPLREGRSGIWKTVQWPGRVLANLQTQHLYVLTATVVIGAGIFSSLSRGAILGFAVSVLVALIVAVRNRLAALVFIVILAGAAFGLASWTGQADAILQRIETMKDVNEAAAPRTEHWKDSWLYVQDHLPSGSGLGTYRYMYPPYQHRNFDRWFLHAENQYLETLGELGVVGCLLLFLLIAAQFYACLKLLRRKSSFDKALGAAGLSLLLGQAVSSIVGFGLFLPANSILMATICGIVIGRAAIDPRQLEHREIGSTAGTESQHGWKRSGPPVFAACIVLMLGMVAVTAFAIRESYSIESSYRAQRLLDEFDSGSGLDPELLERADRLLDRSLAIRDDDHQSYFLKGMVHVYRYRLALRQKLLDEGRTFESDAVAWQFTSLSELHGLAQYYRRSKPEEFEKLQAAELTQGPLQDAWHSFTKSLELCPMIPSSQLRLAKLSVLFEGVEREKLRIEDCLKRLPFSSELYYEVGLIALQSGDTDAAAEYWHSSLSLSERFEPLIIGYGRAGLKMKQLYEQVLPQNPRKLLKIAKKYFTNPAQELPNKLLLVHTVRVLENYALPAGERLFLRAELELMAGRPSIASGFYRRAIESNPEELDWLFSYAECLYGLGRFDEAIQQLDLCRSLSPEPSGKIARLLRLSRRDKLIRDRQKFKQSLETDPLTK